MQAPVQSRPPRTEAELFDRAKKLSGWPLASIADTLREPVPDDLRRAKGWVGNLIERALGARGSNLPQPDFADLGVELKTIPVSEDGRPKQSTFVCTAPIADMPSLEWKTSRVRHKLGRVLWIPIEAGDTIPIAERRVGSPLIWSPTEEEEATLARDWEGIAAVVAAGYVESIRADRGVALQMRPKGANARARRWGTDEEGGSFKTAPRGFYLRTSFTGAILARHFIVAR